jgi:regulator of sirC expression with transglutaminase-like and TPR domain
VDVQTFDPEEEDLDEERACFDPEQEDFDLLYAASLLPRTAGLVPEPLRVRREIEALAELVRGHPETEDDWPGSLVALLDVLFGVGGFEGDTDSYDDPQNSFLDRVLERRRGLPISLSLIVREVARAAGLTAHGVAFPGHFLVSLEHERQGGLNDLVVLDPFHGGRMLTPTDLEQMLSRVSRSPVELMPEHLMPAGDRAILVRMLVNLRGSFARRRDPVGMFRVLSRLLLLRPGHPEVLAERAVVRRDLLDLAGAREDAEQAMALAPDEDAPAARRARRVLKNLTLDRFSIH